MSDKMKIITDGTIKGTKITLNGKDMTKDYKVVDIYFNANGGYTYNSEYSDNTYVNPPSVDYNIRYIDSDDKMKSISASTPSTNYQYGALAQKDSISYVGLEDQSDDLLRDKILDSFDEMRDNGTIVPERANLTTRTTASLVDKYNDLVSDIETKAKKTKEDAK